jgi:hypothetical protein
MSLKVRRTIGRVPGADEDRAVPGRGQCAPVAPVLGTLVLLVRRLSVGLDPETARIHPVEEASSDLGFPAALDPADEGHQAQARRGQGVLCREDARAQQRDPLRVLLLVHRQADLGALEHERSIALPAAPVNAPPGP